MSDSLPLLPELWEKIFTYLTDPEDFQAVINTCEEWYDLMEYEITARLFGKVLSILVDGGSSHPIYEDWKRNVPQQTLLTMRQVHSEWKKEVDKVLSTTPKRQVYLSSLTDVETFMNDAEPLYSRHGNPFLGRGLRVYTGIYDTTTAEALRRLLEACGRHLRTVCLILSHGVITPTELSEYLQLIPLIEDLTIEGIFDIEDEGNETKIPVPVTFAPLAKLKRLDITQTKYRRADDEEKVMLFSSLLRCCCDSLTFLRLNGNVLKIPGINELIPNVKELFVWGPLYATQNPQVLSDLRIGLEQITILSIIEPSMDFLFTLNNFRNTLAYLQLSIRVDENFDPAHLPMLPNLKGLLLYVRSSLKDVPADTQAKLSLVPASFPSLEFLAIMFDRAFQDINILVASDKIKATFQRMKIVRLERAEDEDSD